MRPQFNLPIRLQLGLCLALFALLAGCSDSSPKNPSESLAEASDDSATEHLVKHLDKKYVCPMHPQIVEDEPGNCPICGMNLVEKTVDSGSSMGGLQEGMMVSEMMPKPKMPAEDMHDHSMPQAGSMPSESMAEAADDSANEHLLKHLDKKYVCPMHPQIVEDEPGNCPICGMNLVEKTIDGGSSMGGLQEGMMVSEMMPKPQMPAGDMHDHSMPQADSMPSESMAEAADDSANEHLLKHLDKKYVCPMHPQIVEDEPGNCPICGMNLVEKTVQKPSKNYPAINVSNAMVQSMGVRTVPIEIAALQTTIQTLGRIEYDETRLEHVHPRASGWMEKLYFRAEGDPVKRGQPLGEFYSPDILSAQVDYLIALSQPSGIKTEKARNGLRLLGVSEGTIRQIEKRKESLNTVPIYAPVSGVVTQLAAREGMYVKPETEIFTIADLSKIWVLVDVFEHQIEWLKTGLKASITVPAYPGKSWQGEVEYIYPELDPMSRTLQVRLAFDNPDKLLKANMFAEVSIEGEAINNAVLIPAEALIETGERTSVVLALGDGRFQPVDVITGARANNRVQILRGLTPGDQVVVSGQFLIDSESSLQASFLRMMEGDR